VQALSFTLVLNLPLLPTDWPQDVAQTADPNSNFAISFHPDKTGGALVDQDGNPAQAFDPHGMSGAPVWLFDRDTLEDDNPYYAFFGIYTGFYGTSQCFKGTKLDALLDQISAHTGLEIPQT